jgi:hypothetical protein
MKYIGILFILINFFNLSIQNNITILSDLNNLSKNISIVNTTEKSINFNTKHIPPYLRRKTKYCNFKCDCFFSHSVKNDNICVDNWIKPSGL